MFSPAFTQPDEVKLVTDTMMHLAKTLQCDQSLDLSKMPPPHRTGGKHGYFDDRDRIISLAFKEKKLNAEANPNLADITPVRLDLCIFP